MLRAFFIFYDMPTFAILNQNNEKNSIVNLYSYRVNSL